MNLASKIPKAWAPYLEEDLSKDYFKSLQNFLAEEYKQKKVIYPLEENIFKALEIVGPSKVKACLLYTSPSPRD